MDFHAQIRSLPDQLSWAEKLAVPDLARPRSILVAGMGGSGISGDFAAVLAARSGVRLDVVKGYDLPGWAPEERPLVIALSYSGNTEETLSVVGQARGHDLDVVGVSSGGALASAGLDHHITPRLVGVPTRVALSAVGGHVGGGERRHRRGGAGHRIRVLR